MEKIKIVSIDPSFRNTALVYSEFENNKLNILDIKLIQTKSTPKKLKRPVMPDRFRRTIEIITGVESFMKKYDTDVVIFEYPTGSQSSAAAIGVGVSLMLCSYASTFSNLKSVGVTAKEVKNFVNGTNKAEKKEVIELINKMYPGVLPTKNKKGDIHEGKAEHIADAIVVACVGVEKYLINKNK